MDYSKFPPEFRDFYQSIDSEVIWVHAKWIVYQQIFSNKEDNTDLLNRSAGFFFGIVQMTIFEDTLLGISRLTDPAETYGKKNRSLEQVIDVLNNLGYTELATDLTNDLEQIKSLSEPFRQWRNRKIAHSDLETMKKVNPDPLPGITTNDIEGSLSKISGFMNKINGYFIDSDTIYDHFSTHSGGRRLLAMLRIADKAEMMRRQGILRDIDSER